jgi:membrane-associated protease RseP (regulator of RpoE activity)
MGISQEAAMSRYEDIVGRIERALGAEWNFVILPPPPGFPTFTRAVRFRFEASPATIARALSVRQNGPSNTGRANSVGSDATRDDADVTLIVRVYAGGPKSSSGTLAGAPYSLTVAIQKDKPRLPREFTTFSSQQSKRTIGVYMMYPLDPTIMRSLGEDHGIYVAGGDPDGSSTKAGLKAGDVILSVNGSAIWDWNDYTSRIEGFGIGEGITVIYSRDREEHEAKITVAEDKHPQSAAGDPLFLEKFFGLPSGTPNAAPVEDSAAAVDRIRSGRYSQMPTPQRVGVRKCSHKDLAGSRFAV